MAAAVACTVTVQLCPMGSWMPVQLSPTISKFVELLRVDVRVPVLAPPLFVTSKLAVWLKVGSGPEVISNPVAILGTISISTAATSIKVVPTLPNSALTLSPVLVTAAKAVIEIKPTIRPYPLSVAPFLLKYRFTVTLHLHFYVNFMTGYV